MSVSYVVRTMIRAEESRFRISLDHINSVQLWHAKIEQRYFGSMCYPEVNRFLAVGSFRNDHHVRLPPDHRCQTFQNGDVIVGDKHPNFLRLRGA